MSLHEKKLAEIEKKAERYYDTYRDQMDLLNKSLLVESKGGNLDPYDVYCLGKQLEAFDVFRSLHEQEGSVNTLGSIPRVAYDVITAVHGSSIVPMIASVQPIEEERGNVYFRQTRVRTTKGSATQGDVIVDPRTGQVTPNGYASNRLAETVIGATAAATVNYTITLPAVPVKLQSLSLSVANLAGVVAKDVGPAQGGNPNIGQIWGNGLSGTVNYTTGELNLTFAADPGAGNDIIASFQQNYEESADLPKIDSYYDSVSVEAQVFALKSVYGLLQSYGMKKRFGMSLEDELSKELVRAINAEIGGTFVRQYGAAALGETIFYKTAPAGVSYFEHKQTYADTLAEAEAKIIDNSGHGAISTLIVGKNHAAVLQTLPGFKKISDGRTLGSHLFGNLNGVNVIRVTEDAILGTNDGLALWKGSSPFDAPGAYAPYMPLATTDAIPLSPNPLTNQKAAAVWAGVQTMVPGYITKVTLNPGAAP